MGKWWQKTSILGGWCEKGKPPLTSPATKANGGKNQPDGIVTARQRKKSEANTSQCSLKNN